MSPLTLHASSNVLLLKKPYTLFTVLENRLLLVGFPQNISPNIGGGGGVGRILRVFTAHIKHLTAQKKKMREEQQFDNSRMIRKLVWIKKWYEEGNCTCIHKSSVQAITTKFQLFSLAKEHQWKQYYFQMERKKKLQSNRKWRSKYIYLFFSSSSFHNFSLPFFCSVDSNLELGDLWGGGREELLLLYLL